MPSVAKKAMDDDFGSPPTGTAVHDGWARPMANAEGMQVL
jgi:hypothetical protein